MDVLDPPSGMEEFDQVFSIVCAAVQYIIQHHPTRGDLTYSTILLPYQSILPGAFLMLLVMCCLMHCCQQFRRVQRLLYLYFVPPFYQNASLYFTMYLTMIVHDQYGFTNIKLQHGSITVVFQGYLKNTNIRTKNGHDYGSRCIC